MSGAKYFRLRDGRAEKLTAHAAGKERDIQNIFEDNLEALLGVRLVESEYRFRGRDRSDTLGLDASNRPVVIEYKRDEDDTIINQAMGYAAKLKRQKLDFEQMVKDRLGEEVQSAIRWDANVRVICVAANFNDDDCELEKRTSDLELVRYALMGKHEFMLLEWVGKLPAEEPYSQDSAISRPSHYDKSIAEASPELRARYEKLRNLLLSLGGSVSEHTKRKDLIIFRYNGLRRNNRIQRSDFITVQFRQNKMLHIALFLDLEKKTDSIEQLLSQGLLKHCPDKRKCWFEISIYSDEDLERTKPLLQRAYKEWPDLAKYA